MKKLLLTTLIAAMLLVPLGTVALADDQSAPVPAAEPAEITEPDVSLSVRGRAPAQSSPEIMAPALHAVLLAMENQGMTSFSSEDPAVAWEMLYNLLSMYGQLDDRSDFAGEQLILPSEIVADYARAILPGLPGALPESLSDRMTYDPGCDEYRLYCGSDDLSEVRFLETENTGSTVVVTGSLVYLAENLELARFTAVLELSDTMFGYTLTELKVM